MRKAWDAVEGSTKTKHSDRDGAYITAVNSGNMATAQRMVDESDIRYQERDYDTPLMTQEELEQGGIERITEAARQAEIAARAADEVEKLSDTKVLKEAAKKFLMFK